jgi:hypothetical protein
MIEETPTPRKKGVSKGLIVGLVVIVGALAIGLANMSSSAISTVTFRDAKRATYGVWISGAPKPGSIYYDEIEKGTRAILVEESGPDAGATMLVIFRGPKAPGLESAMTTPTKISAQGVWDVKSHQFFADNLVVKCPNEYKGQPPGDRKYKSKPISILDEGSPGMK